MKIAVVGTGYVGLVTGTCFAETGNKVICVDIDAAKVEKMRNGFVPIYEPGLEQIFHKNTKAGRLSFTTNLAEAVAEAQVIFLALPTPPGGDGAADLSYILGVAKQLGALIKDYKVIVDKSTVPVGTAELVEKALLENGGSKALFDVVSNPEFLREGVAVEDFLKPDRVVIGTDNERVKKVMDELYAPYVRQGNPLIYMDIRSAEMTKYAANAYLATRITFMNEIANLCTILNANVDDVRKGMGADSRIGKRFLFPGVGYGGSCFPKDVQALHKTANDNQYDFKILDSVMKVNEKQRHLLAERVKSHYGNTLKGRHFAIWGLAFKPNTDDIREAPALYIIQDLLDAGATVSAYDPEAMNNVKQVFGDKIQFSEEQYSTLDNADALLIVTEWTEFRTPDFDLIREKLKEPKIFDGRNLFDLDKIKEIGFYYESIGRLTILPS